MTSTIKIDFVSDVSCPWCVIGLKSLEAALVRLLGDITADLHFQPFELNPQMAPEGQNIVEHIAQKYGATPEQSAQTRAMIRERAAGVGFEMRTSEASRIYNTFDAHRLLHWAGLEGRQAALKHAMFKAYFTDGAVMSDRSTLADIAEGAGLDRDAAAEILAGDSYADEVRSQERFFQEQGINSVPAIIINDKHLISGGQPVEIFERALREIAAAV
ncbi:DsbA family oxidoreductase [Dongia mobilis]|uniref:DsbA family oxidoreductase n=1 Tax=Dongia sp. TaxID=1977262 RepID=UPI0026EDB3D6